jgi:hypothetical protein
MNVKYAKVLLHLTVQLVLFLLHVSAENHSHLQGATNVEGMYSMLCRLSIRNGKMFVQISVIHKHTVLLTLH